MLKGLSTLLSGLILFNLFFCPLVQASNLSVQTSGSKIDSLSGDAPVRRIGKLRLPDGVVVLKDNRIDILFDSLDLTEKTGVGEKKKTLTGTCFALTKTVSHGRPCVTGFTYLDGGTSFAEIDQPGVVETVSLTDGSSCHGQITSVTSEKITLTTPDGERQIDTASVKDVSSPRVFAVSIPYAEDGQSFEAKFTRTSDSSMTSGAVSTTVAKQKPSANPSDSNRKKKIIVTVIVACLIATAIALPIALACGGNNGNNNNNSFANQVAFRNLFARETPTPAP